MSIPSLLACHAPMFDVSPPCRPPCSRPILIDCRPCDSSCRVECIRSIMAVRACNNSLPNECQCSPLTDRQVELPPSPSQPSPAAPPSPSPSLHVAGLFCFALLHSLAGQSHLRLWSEDRCPSIQLSDNVLFLARWPNCSSVLRR